MTEFRPSLRPHEVRLIVRALRSVRARTAFKLNPPEVLDSRDFAIYAFADDELVLLIAKFEALIKKESA